MVEGNSIETPNLHAIPLSAISLDSQQFRLNKINEIKDYFIAEIRERELKSKKFSKSLIVLSATSGKRFYCMIYNSYWNACRNSKCKS